MHKFELCNAKTCVDEILALGNHNMKMWTLFECLSTTNELRYGTQAEVIKLYVEHELVAYSLFENYEARSDKNTLHQGTVYQDLGVIHFITLPKHRKKGYATLLANELYKEIITPLLARHTDVHAYVVATGLAAPLMKRTAIAHKNLILEFYSEASFQSKVVDYLAE